MKRSFSNFPSLRLTYLDLVYTTGKVKKGSVVKRELASVLRPLPCVKSESDSREMFGLAREKRALCTSFIKVCDKNPVSADFYGSNMRGKLTDAPDALHPRATQQRKPEQIKSVLFPPLNSELRCPLLERQLLLPKDLYI